MPINIFFNVWECLLLTKNTMSKTACLCLSAFWHLCPIAITYTTSYQKSRWCYVCSFVLYAPADIWIRQLFLLFLIQYSRHEEHSFFKEEIISYLCVIFQVWVFFSVSDSSLKCCPLLQQNVWQIRFFPTRSR